MSTPYIGQIILFAGDFAPVGWAVCDSRLLSISEFPVLFDLIGTTYGGDGQDSFALPDLRGKVPLGQGRGPGLSSYQLGANAGVEAVTLTTGQMPAHSHPVSAVNQPGNAGVPSSGLMLAQLGGQAATQYKLAAYAAVSEDSVGLSPASIAGTGGSQPHDNRQPYQTINYCIALDGLYPT